MRWVAWVALAALIAPAGAVLAQDTGEPLRPEISFPDVEREEPVIPLDEAGLVDLEAEIECPKASVPAVTRTEIVFRSEAPSFANVILSPNMHIHGHGTNCPPGESKAVNTTMSVSLTQNAPAFESFDVPVELVVKRTADEAPLPTRTYTAHANATFTPGYFPLVNVRAEQKIAQVAEGGEATYPVTVDNFSNGATEMAFSIVDQTDGATVDLPESAVMDTQEKRRFEVTISDEPGGNRSFHKVEVRLDATSTNPEAEDRTNDSISYRLGIEGSSDGDAQLSSQSQEASTASPGLLALAAGTSLAALSLRRLGSQSR